MTKKDLKSDNNFYSVKKHGKYYLAFTDGNLKGVSVYDDIFRDGSYLVYVTGCLDTTINGVNFWLHGHGY